MTNTKVSGQPRHEPAAPKPIDSTESMSATRIVTVPEHEYDELLADRELLHRLIADDTSPLNGAVWRAVQHLAEVVAVRRLRALSGDLASAQDWSRVRPSYAELERRRNARTVDARSAEEIRRQARESWGLPA